MDLKQIEYILRTVEEKSVSRAAMKLFISRSALNQQFLKLERGLGTPLLYRTRHSWELAEIKGLYIQGACEVTLTKKNTYHRIADVLGRFQRSFSLGVSDGRDIATFTSMCPRFLQMHPNVSIPPLEIGSCDIQNMTANENLNLGFITIGPREKTGTSYICIYSEESYAALPSSHPITRPIKSREKEYPQLDLRLLKDESFVPTYQKSSCHAVTDSVFQEAEFSPSILSETSGTAGTPSFVSSGIYCATVSKCYAKNMDEISLFSLPSHPYWDLDFCYARQSYISQPLKTFIEPSKGYWKSYYQDQ